MRGKPRLRRWRNMASPQLQVLTWMMWMWRLKLAMSKLKLSVREAREGLVDLSPGRAKFVAKPCASLDHQCPGERPKRGHGIHHLVLKTVMRQSQTCEHSQQSGPQMKDIQGGHRVLIFSPSSLVLLICSPSHYPSDLHCLTVRDLLFHASRIFLLNHGAHP